MAVVFIGNFIESCILMARLYCFYYLWCVHQQITIAFLIFQLTLNGQKYGFPVEKSDIVAWKDGQTFVIQTNYGAFIKCSYNLDVSTSILLSRSFLTSTQLMLKHIVPAQLGSKTMLKGCRNR